MSHITHAVCSDALMYRDRCFDSVADERMNGPFGTEISKSIFPGNKLIHLSTSVFLAI